MSDTETVVSNVTDILPPAKAEAAKVEAAKVADVALDFDALFAEAETVSLDTRPKRSKVDVPPIVLEKLNASRDAANEHKGAVVVPLKSAAHFEQLHAVALSAGDLMNPVASVTATAGVLKGKVFKRETDLSKATHVRMAVGDRRGKKDKKAAKVTVPPVADSAGTPIVDGDAKSDGVPKSDVK